MSGGEEYKVGFGRTAGTLVYEDSQGEMWFCFDISPSEDTSKGKWTLHLACEPTDRGGKPTEIVLSSERERISLAFEKTKQYALSRGYQVQVS